MYAHRTVNNSNNDDNNNYENNNNNNNNNSLQTLRPNEGLGADS